jgi:hypothetical protein
MRTKNILNLVGGLLLVALVGCGGGGGSAGTPAGSSSVITSGNTGTTTIPTVTPTGVVASDFIFELDKQSLSSAGNERALLSILAVDNNRNILANVPVSISVDQGGVFSSTSAGTVTNATGQFSGFISIGGNKSNRTINTKIVVSGIEKTASVQVVGSQILITPIPATPTPGQAVTVNLDSLDSAGVSIPSVAVSLAGAAGVSGVNTTDLAGKKSLTFNAPALPGSYSIVATGLGVTTTKFIQVVSSTGNSFPAANGVVSSASLSPQPSSIAPNLPNETVNRARLTAKFSTASNQGIQNMRVRFEIIQPALGSGEAISTKDSTVYTDAAGLADADYISGTRSSPTNGVKIRACYKTTEFTSLTDCPNSVQTTLTVAGTPLSISISDDNLLEKGLGNIAYLKKFLLQVNDASGVAVKGAIVSASVDITHFGKGNFGGLYPLDAVAPSIQDPSLAYIATGTNTVSPISSANISPGFLLNSSNNRFANVWCANEDINRNARMDLGEDINGDGSLTPSKAEVIVSYVSGNTTDANGQMLVQVTYGQNVGRWLSYTLRVTTQVAGSEGERSKSYITDVLQGDVANGSFLTPPYGVGSCSVRN